MKTFKNESAFTKWFCDCIENIGGFCFAIVGGVRQKSGMPDRYVSHSMWQGFIEFKKDGNKVKKGSLQDINLRRLYNTKSNACSVKYLKPITGSSGCIHFYDVHGTLKRTLSLDRCYQDAYWGQLFLQSLRNTVNVHEEPPTTTEMG